MLTSDDDPALTAIASQDYPIMLVTCLQERQGTAAGHKNRMEQVQGELASLQAQLHSANAMTDQLQLQHQESTSQCHQAKRDLKVTEEALGSLEGEHRKFVEQATAVCNQKDAAIAVWFLADGYQTSWARYSCATMDLTRGLH